MISSARLRILFIRPTHSSWFWAFSSSVTPSAAFICSMIKSSRSSACSFRSARYVHNFPVRIRELYRAGCSCLRYHICGQATRTLYDEYGTPYVCLDEWMKHHLENKLI